MLSCVSLSPFFSSRFFGSCVENPQVTGTGGEEQPDAAPTPTPAPAGAPAPTPAQTPAPAAGIGGLVGVIKNAVSGGGGSSSGGDTAAGAGASGAPPADAAPGMLGNLTSSISSAAHSVTDAASGIMGHKKDGDAAVPAAGEGAAAEKEGKHALVFFAVCSIQVLETHAHSSPCISRFEIYSTRGVVANQRFRHP